ncbi:MAG: MFS transporter [Candidatus Heimdallarchaeota archaeon]|nr:MFS transporter [Candidatus Heimdallarchaeota archaeon]
MSFYNNFIGLKELPKEARSIIRNYSFIDILVSFSFSLTNTFYILYIIDTVGFREAGVITAISVGVQLLIDYPSGSLGDLIGHKWVFTMALISFSISFYLMSVAIVFSDFVIAAIFFGFSNAQASGALQSWLDNSYKNIKDNPDADRKNYGYSMNKIRAISSLIMGMSFMLGGFLTLHVSRQVLFRFQSVLILITAFLVLKILNNSSTTTEGRLGEDKSVFKEYMHFLKGGIKFLFSSRKAFTFILGMSLMQVTWAIWATLLLFPLYFGYTGSDSIAGVLRSSIFFAGVIAQIMVSGLTKKVENDKLPLFMLVQGLMLFFGAITLLYFVPIQNSFNLFGSVLVFVLMLTSVSFLMPFIQTIVQRLFVDFVPSENRNGVYSLMPTISGLFTVPLLPIVGSIVQTSGLISGLWLIVGILMSSLFFVWIAINSDDKSYSVPISVSKVAPIAGN